MAKKTAFTPKRMDEETTPEVKPTKKSKTDTLESKAEHFIPTVSVDTSKLPSRGLAYPKNAEINYRPYSYGEVKKVSQSKLSETEQFDFLVNGITVTGIEHDDLTLGDIMFIAIYRKLSTLGGSKIRVTHKCKGCGKPSENIVELASISANFIKAPKLPMKIVFDDEVYKFGPMTLGQYKKAYGLMLSKPDLDEEFCLMSVQCLSHEFDKVYNRFYNLSTSSEIESLSKIDEYLGHGLKPVSVKCKNLVDDKDVEPVDGKTAQKECGHQTEIELDGGQALLLPFRELEESIGRNIHFGD